MPPAPKEGEDGALPGLLPSSPPENLQGLGPWPRTKQGGEDGSSRSLQTRSSIRPMLVNRRRLPSLLIPPMDSPGRGPRLPPRRHAMHPNGSGRDVIHNTLLPFGDTVLHGACTSLLELLLTGGADPHAAGASAGHHVRQSSNCPVMEAHEWQCSCPSSHQRARTGQKSAPHESQAVPSSRQLPPQSAHLCEFL